MEEKEKKKKKNVIFCSFIYLYIYSCSIPCCPVWWESNLAAGCRARELCKQAEGALLFLGR